MIPKSKCAHSTRGIHSESSVTLRCGAVVHYIPESTTVSSGFRALNVPVLRHRAAGAGDRPRKAHTHTNLRADRRRKNSRFGNYDYMRRLHITFNRIT